MNSILARTLMKMSGEPVPVSLLFEDGISARLAEYGISDVRHLVLARRESVATALNFDAAQRGNVVIEKVLGPVLDEFGLWIGMTAVECEMAITMLEAPNEDT